MVVVMFVFMLGTMCPLPDLYLCDCLVCIYVRWNLYIYAICYDCIYVTCNARIYLSCQVTLC